MKTLFKAVYNFIPFKMEFYKALRKIWKPSQSMYRHFHFTGVFNVPLDEQKRFKIKHYGYELENEIFWGGLADGWEKESVKLWIELCRDAKIIFDVGANTGIYALIAKATNPHSKVYAFEPVARVFHKLQENISLNKFDIIPIEKAVSNSDGTAIIYDTSSEHTYSVTVNKNLASPGTNVFETKIETVTLNSFVRQNNIKKVDVIKIDVETHEPEVLEGFLDYLFEFKPSLLIEILTDEVGERVSAILQNSDYLYFNIDERGGIRQVDKITKSDYYNYLLCGPATAKKLGLVKGG
jgi:FkbM family methyltransferase